MKPKARSPRKTRAPTPTAPPTDLGLASILVPSDFSPASEKSVAAAAALARMSGGKLVLLHVVDPPAAPGFIKGFPLAMENEETSEQCKRHLQEALDRAGVEPELVERVIVRFGRAYHEIVSAARTLKSDLIVIATHGRTGLKHVLLGSTTERVVQHAPCPVLVVRPRGRDFLR
jgi:universal stress protein A